MAIGNIISYYSNVFHPFAFIVFDIPTATKNNIESSDIYLAPTAWYVNHFNELCKFKEVS